MNGSGGGGHEWSTDDQMYRDRETVFVRTRRSLVSISNGNPIDQMFGRLNRLTCWYVVVAWQQHECVRGVGGL